MGVCGKKSGDRSAISLPHDRLHLIRLQLRERIVDASPAYSVVFQSGNGRVPEYVDEKQNRKRESKDIPGTGFVEAGIIAVNQDDQGNYRNVQKFEGAAGEEDGGEGPAEE